MKDKSFLKCIHTLGEVGTNSERAAKFFIEKNKLSSEIVLHKTFEEAMKVVLMKSSSALMTCIAYPQLHSLIFPYLDSMVLGDVFLFNTHSIVLATNKERNSIKRVASHLATNSLISDDVKVIPTNSTVEAAHFCFSGYVDACITTLPAAQSKRLVIVRDFGEVPMGFAIHVHRSMVK